MNKSWLGAAVFFFGAGLVHTAASSNTKVWMDETTWFGRMGARYFNKYWYCGYFAAEFWFLMAGIAVALGL